MPDGTGVFSAPRASNRFDVGEWNICKQLTSRRHPAFPPKYARALSVTGRPPLSVFRHLIILPSYYQKLDFCDCRHRAANRASLFSASWLRERKPWKSSKRRRLPNSSAVVTTFAAGHRHKSDKYLGAVLRSKNHKQSQPQSSIGEKRG